MESKLLVGGKNIVDHTNEQQKILEQKRQEIAEQVTCHSFLERMECVNATEQISFLLDSSKVMERTCVSPFLVGDSSSAPSPIFLNRHCL